MHCLYRKVSFCSWEVKRSLHVSSQIIDSSKDDLRFYALPERGIKIALGQAPLPDGIYLSEFPELSQSC